MAGVSLRIGILALQGDVLEHVRAIQEAAKNLMKDVDIIEVRTKKDLQDLAGLIIPGGESTVLQKLCEREDMIDDLTGIKAIFGTCAGAIMLAKKINNKEADQRTLGLMDIEIDRNAYGRQADSFERDIETEFGKIHTIFIRAPRIVGVGSSVRTIATLNKEIIACEQESGGKYYLATCFHPELSTTKFHEHFLKRAAALHTDVKNH